jgi:hypothetical protein
MGPVEGCDAHARGTKGGSPAVVYARRSTGTGWAGLAIDLEATGQHRPLRLHL